MQPQTLATCPCGWTGPLDDLALAYFDLVCPECGADDWRVNLVSGEIAMQVMSEAFRAVVELAEGEKQC